MENSEENEIEKIESTTQVVKRKKRILLNIGIVLIIMQFFKFYEETRHIKNLNFNKINSNYYGFFISTFLGENLFLTIGVLLIAIYFFINRKNRVR